MSKKKPFEGTTSWAVGEYTRKQRRKRLSKIMRAYGDVEDELFDLRAMAHGYKRPYTPLRSYESLMYLVRLARKAR